MIYQNTSKKTITLQIEPWCELYKIEPQQLVVIEFENGLIDSDIELVQEEEFFTIYGNFNNRISVYLNKTKLAAYFE
jgi:hypothetical protein